MCAYLLGVYFHILALFPLYMCVVEPQLYLCASRYAMLSVLLYDPGVVCLLVITRLAVFSLTLSICMTRLPVLHTTPKAQHLSSLSLTACVRRPAHFNGSLFTNVPRPPLCAPWDQFLQRHPLLPYLSYSQHYWRGGYYILYVRCNEKIET